MKGKGGLATGLLLGAGAKLVAGTAERGVLVTTGAGLVVTGSTTGEAETAERGVLVKTGAGLVTTGGTTGATLAGTSG